MELRSLTSLFVLACIAVAASAEWSTGPDGWAVGLRAEAQDGNPETGLARCIDPPLAAVEWNALLGAVGRSEPTESTWTALATRCIEAPPALATRLNEHGLAWHRRRRYDVSARFFELATRLDPDANRARFNLACARSRLGNIDGALTSIAELEGHPDADRWLDRATRDADLYPVWARPDAWLRDPNGVPRVLRFEASRAHTWDGIIDVPLPASDAALAWHEIALDRDTLRRLLEVPLAYSRSGRPRDRYSIVAEPPHVQAPIPGEVPVAALELVRRPAIWRPTPDRRMLVVPVLASNTQFARAGVVIFGETPDGRTGFIVSTFGPAIENHGVPERSDVIVTRDRSALGVTAELGDDLLRRWFFVRDGRLFTGP